MKVNDILRNKFVKILAFLFLLMLVLSPKIKKEFDKSVAIKREKQLNIEREKFEERVRAQQIEREKEKERKAEEKIKNIRVEFGLDPKEEDTSAEKKLTEETKKPEQKKVNNLIIRNGDEVLLQAIYILDGEVAALDPIEIPITEGSKFHYTIEKNIMGKKVGYIFDITMIDFIDDRYYKKEFDKLEARFREEMRKIPGDISPEIRNMSIRTKMLESGMTMRLKIADIKRPSKKSNTTNSTKNNNTKKVENKTDNNKTK